MSTSTQVLPIYQELLKKYQEIVLLSNVNWLVSWDMDTFMPSRAADQKSQQIAFLSKLLHNRKTDPQIGSFLQELKKSKNYNKLAKDEQRNIELIQREYDRLTKIPTSLVQQFSKQKAKTYDIWRKKAKPNADFKVLQPELEKLVELVKKRAYHLDPNKKVLDVLMDIHEPGLNVNLLNSVFKELKEGLIPLMNACVNSSHQPDLSLIHRPCPKAVQKKVGLDQMAIVQYVGGRLDESVHPITYGYYDDVRITTRYNLDDFTDCFYSVMHESGHALYNQNFPEGYKYQPIGSSCSGGMHEGQARFIENIIGRNPAFWEFYLPRFKRLTGTIFEDVELEPFVHAINHVQPSKTRVSADEVTYTLHLIFRMEIEEQLFAGKINVEELPSLWNEKMEEYFDIEIENDTEGVLQDIHWPYAAFGYFPNFAFGNIYGGQLLWQLKQDLPNWLEELRTGNLSPIISWLVTNVHQKGALLDPQELIKQITGREVSPKYFLEYLEEKYSKLYDL